MTRSLIFGGARSGKSAYAERLAIASGKEVLYVATAQAGDGEMTARIALHRARRPPAWRTLEEGAALGQVIATHSAPQCIVLIDCLTIWLSNLLFSQEQVFAEIGQIVPPDCVAVQRAHLLASLAQARGDVILVSNEIGMGVVPQGALSRWFVDAAGELNQAVAAVCDHVVLVAAGLPLTLKGAT